MTIKLTATALSETSAAGIALLDASGSIKGVNSPAAVTANGQEIRIPLSELKWVGCAIDPADANWVIVSFTLPVGYFVVKGANKRNTNVQKNTHVAFRVPAAYCSEEMLEYAAYLVEKRAFTSGALSRLRQLGKGSNVFVQNLRISGDGEATVVIDGMVSGVGDDGAFDSIRNHVEFVNVDNLRYTVYKAEMVQTPRRPIQQAGTIPTTIASVAAPVAVVKPVLATTIAVPVAATAPTAVDADDFF